MLLTLDRGLVPLDHMPFIPYAKMSDRQRIMRKLAADGKSYAEIAALMNISRQRVHQLLTGYKSPAYRKSKQTQGIAA